MIKPGVVVGFLTMWGQLGVRVFGEWLRWRGRVACSAPGQHF